MSMDKRQHILAAIFGPNILYLLSKLSQRILKSRDKKYNAFAPYLTRCFKLINFHPILIFDCEVIGLASTLVGSTLD
jgi:hypothetical protein